jgi:hypothetical protein
MNLALIGLLRRSNNMRHIQWNNSEEKEELGNEYSITNDDSSIAVQLFLSSVNDKYNWVAIHCKKELKGYEYERYCNLLNKPCWNSRMIIPLQDLDIAKNNPEQYLLNVLYDIR